MDAERITIKWLDFLLYSFVLTYAAPPISIILKTYSSNQHVSCFKVRVIVVLKLSIVIQEQLIGQFLIDMSI